MLNSARTQPPPMPRRIMTEADFAGMELEYSQMFDSRMQPRHPQQQPAMTEADFACLELRNSQMFNPRTQPPSMPRRITTEADFALLELRNSQMFNPRTQPPSTPRRIMTEVDFARLELEYSQMFDSRMQPRHPRQQSAAAETTTAATASRRRRSSRDDGLPAQVISKYLKIRNADECCDKDGDRKICAVCLDDVCGLKDAVATLDQCGHEFHSCCLRRWLRRKNTCPLCKRIALNF